MNIAMVTNTYLPHVGGVANSVHTFAEAYRAKGHTVTVIAPEFEDAPEKEADVIRVPALQHFNGSDFSVSLPLVPPLTRKMKARKPDLFHSHHPFLLGDTALRMAATLGKPLIFTYHTMYEHYTHYVPADSPVIRRFAKKLAVEYCNLCDHVIAPSDSVREIIQGRGVTAPISVIPTGIDPNRFADGDGDAFRAAWGLPAEAVVVGHVGRLAREKNGVFLASALAAFIREQPEQRRALIVGAGPADKEMREVFEKAGIADRAIFPGKLTGRALADAYRAMDLFAFSSKTETQGMVLAEAMAAEKPVVALDAPGARDIVRDRANGRLVMEERVDAFADAVRWMAQRSEQERAAFRAEARRTAEAVSVDVCTDAALKVYEEVLATWRVPDATEFGPWNSIRLRLQQEWEIWNERINALESALSDEEDRA